MRHPGLKWKSVQLITFFLLAIIIHRLWSLQGLTGANSCFMACCKSDDRDLDLIMASHVTLVHVLAAEQETIVKSIDRVKFLIFTDSCPMTSPTIATT